VKPRLTRLPVQFLECGKGKIAAAHARMAITEPQPVRGNLPHNLQGASESIGGLVILALLDEHHERPVRVSEFRFVEGPAQRLRSLIPSPHSVETAADCGCTMELEVKAESLMKLAQRVFEVAARGEEVQSVWK